MVYMVMVVNIVCAPSTSHIDAGAQSSRCRLRELLTSIVTSFDASITGDELNSTVQLPNFRSVVVLHAACRAACMDAIYSARLAQLLTAFGIYIAIRNKVVTLVAAW